MSNIVFIPGIKGSQLYEGEHKRWYPSTASDLDALVLNNPLTPGEPIRQVAIPKLLKKVTVYKGILDEFSERNLKVFTYDWRQSVLSHLADLDALLDTIDGRITLIAHSMGGLLLKAYLLQGASDDNKAKIDKVITIGTPWHGSPFAYRVLRYGETIYAEDDGIGAGLSLDRDRVAKLLGETYPSVYELMPSETYYNMEGGKFAIREDNTPASWQEIMSSLSHSQFQNYTQYALPLQELMQQPLDVPHFALIGYGFATLQSIGLTGSERKKGMKQQSTFFNGDFTVPLISARTPNANEFFVRGQHSELCSMEETLNWIKWVLNGGHGQLPAGITTTVPDAQRFSSKIFARIMCPVGFTVTDCEGNSLAGDLDPERVDFSKLEQYSNFYTHTVGEAKYLFFNNDGGLANEIVIKAYDTGLANIAIIPTHDDDGANDETGTYFESVPVDPTTVLNLKLPTSEAEEPELTVSNSEVKRRPVKTVSVQQDQPTGEHPFPKFIVKVEPAKGVQKNRHAKPHVYAGDVVLTITGDLENIVEMFWLINGGRPNPYEGETVISVQSGTYVLDVVARDKWGRPLEPYSYEFRIDRDVPYSIPVIEFHPEAGVKVGVKAHSAAGIRASYFQWLIPGRQTHKQATTPAGVSYISLEQIFGPNGAAELEFYSEDKFDRVEPKKRIPMSFKGLPELLWDDTVSAVTPLSIWNHMFDDRPFDGRVEILTKGFNSLGLGDIIPDHARAVRFLDDTMELTIYFSEQYTLYWSGPPREVIKPGIRYQFSFELLTDYKMEVTETNPRVNYYPHPSHTKSNGTPVELSVDENGVFHGSFTISKDFPTDKVKLVVTDDKHKSPPLRETILMVEDE